MHQPSSDRLVDEQVVAGLIAAQFPELAGQPVTRLGVGWDHELFGAPGGAEHDPSGERWRELAGVAPAVRSVLGRELRGLAEPYLSGLEAEPDRAAPLRFIHNDVCPDHLIVDPATGRLAGLIDFTDAVAGDPVKDFVGLIGLGGYEFIARVAASYDLPLGEGFWPRLRWLARMLTLLWLSEAVAYDPGSVPMHLTWVGRAFAQDD